MTKISSPCPVVATAEAERLVEVGIAIYRQSTGKGWSGLRILQEAIAGGVPREYAALAFHVHFNRFPPFVCVSCGHMFWPNDYAQLAHIHCRSCEKNGRVPLTVSDEARAKMSARSTANIAVKRGKLVKQPCSECGDERAEKHHADYSKPLDVTWLCRPCHMKQHAAERAKPAGVSP